MRNFGVILGMSMLAACGSREDNGPPAAEAELNSTVDTVENMMAAPENMMVEPTEPATTANATTEASAPASPPVSACQMQGNERLTITPIRAVGTEPFWGARVEGRCVTYSTPDDQQGTRVWTRYTGGPKGDVWVGRLGDTKFEMRTRPEQGCSDGMSDKRYPIAVELSVNGEVRRGCAETL